ncbi:hypothetical protein LF41_2360 [Lysobacter dokdonensis DS-58]|uniref:Uncharacterized protein n=1 Tax=Lysobacter dokdonensis DS-58 TaxID=1300345 RepID=A0A0A2WM92_9GAMM|nr:hypothetical protein LF41_2360 [Lysobacter dokdonensis DS-58]
MVLGWRRRYGAAVARIETGSHGEVFSFAPFDGIREGRVRVSEKH